MFGDFHYSQDISVIFDTVALDTHSQTLLNSFSESTLCIATGVLVLK